MLSSVNTLVMLGASITAAMVGTRNLAWENYILARTGKVVTVINAGVGGDRLEDIDTRLNTILPTYAGNGNVLFCLHGIANDLLDNAPYRDMSASAQTALYNKFEALIQRIISNGNLVDIGTSTYIDFDLDGSVVDDEDKGSAAFNDAIIIPLAKIYNHPTLFDSAVNRPISDLYNFTFNNHTESQLADGIHYTLWGYEALAHFRLSRLVDALYLGITSLTVPKLADPRIGYKKTPGRFVLDFSTSSAFVPSPNNLGITAVARDLAVVNARVFPTTPELSSVTVTYDSASSNSGGLGNSDDPTNTTTTLYNNAVLSSFHFTTTAGGVKTLIVSGLGAHTKWKVRYACLTALALSISTDLTIAGQSIPNVPPTPFRIREIDVQASIAGTITVSYKAADGFGYAVLNGLEFIPLASEPTNIPRGISRSIKR